MYIYMYIHIPVFVVSDCIIIFIALCPCPPFYIVQFLHIIRHLN